jgi:mRNA interferase HigB
MVIISYGTIREFYEKHPESEDALNNWYRLTLASEWSNFHQAKKVFNSIDAVGNDRFVFNIRGNNYRLIAMIFFDIRTVFIRYIGLHKDYDKIDASTI